MTELDGRVLARAQAGDARAFRVLYEHHADAVYGFLLRMLGQRAAAEDAVQEVFLRVLSALRRFDPAGPARLRTWILAIGRTVALDELRRARRPYPPHAEPAAPAAPTDDLRLALEAAVAALPEAQRTAFLLYECGPLSYEEIAAIEEVDLGTVKSRLHRARGALQAALSEGTNDQKEGGSHRACK